MIKISHRIVAVKKVTHNTASMHNTWRLLRFYYLT